MRIFNLCNGFQFFSDYQNFSNRIACCRVSNKQLGIRFLRVQKRRNTIEKLFANAAKIEHTFSFLCKIRSLMPNEGIEAIIIIIIVMTRKIVFARGK